MINSLFSSFDPNSSIISINYIRTTIPILFFITLRIRIIYTRKELFISNITSLILSELKAIINNKNTKGKLRFLVSIFFILLILNLSGLIPYVFTMTAHITITLRLAIPFWLRFILFSITKNTNHFLRHIVPLRTPIILSQFITIIETIRQIIRPITLSVRLAANITAGHILIALTRAPILIRNIYRIILIILIILEIAVAVIQSYVFTVLLTIYLAETY